MKLRVSFLAVVCLAIAAFAAWSLLGTSPLSAAPSAALASPTAQEEPGNISRVWTMTIKPGMQQQFEEAIVQHWEVHRQLNDPAAYTVFVIEDGEKAGQYGVITSGHHWADFDAHEGEILAADQADFAANVAQYVDSTTSIITAGLPSVSNPPAPGTPYKFAQVYEYRLDFEESAGFVRLLEKAKKAADATGWPWNYSWSTLVSGGEGPIFYAVAFLDNWAAFAGPDQTFEAMLEEAVGREEAEEIMEGFYEAIEGVNVWIARLRPDLSYVPAVQ